MDTRQLRSLTRSVRRIFVSFLIATSPLPATQDASDYAQHFNRGGELLQQMHFHGAVEEFRQAIRINPQYLPAHQALFLGYTVTQCFDLAWQEADFVRHASGEVPARLTRRLGEELQEKDALAKRESNARELEAAQKEATRDLQNASVQGRLSRALLRSCDFPAAQTQAYLTLQQNPLEPQAQFVLATILAGDPPTSQDSIPHWRLYLRNASRITSASADLAQAYESLASAYQHLGKDSECLAALEEGLKVDSDNPRLLNAAAWSYVSTSDAALRNPRKALTYAQQAVAVSKGQRAAILDTLGESLYANGRFDEAISAEKKALALYPDNDFYSDQLKKFQAAKDKSAAPKP